MQSLVGQNQAIVAIIIYIMVVLKSSDQDWEPTVLGTAQSQEKKAFHVLKVFLLSGC